jgi:hypothetical protein
MGEHCAIGQEQGFEVVPPVHRERRTPLTTMSCPSNEVSASVMSALVVKVAAGGEESWS